MLLLNRTLLKMAKGLWGWMGVIVGLKMVTLVGTTMFARDHLTIFGQFVCAQFDLGGGGLRHTGGAFGSDIDVCL